MDESGLKYICEKAERLNAINTVLSYMIRNKPSSRLVKHIIRSYNRLADNEEGRNLLKIKLPPEMKDPEFINGLDESSRKWLQNLHKVLKGEREFITNDGESLISNLKIEDINVKINSYAFIDLDGNIIQYDEICSHIGLASKLVSENETLKELFINSNCKRPDLFLINEIGYISVSVDPVFGISLIANNQKLTDIQRTILMNYGRSGAKITFIDQNIKQNSVNGRHVR